eukprot:CAMPEP_0194568196 /NCGR_PEP_ID=MMETSP0292-20121207/6413_1 /TAXON_ID=39354 /ORGANISM="Heterosigma akashiwo, Strain CCMP2393" /LENGTH=56 /DNA_ID=CAMNT_0039418207 /DNA_START=585 /DNA_END=751 /DNA_ORIENTATION=+
MKKQQYSYTDEEDPDRTCIQAGTDAKQLLGASRMIALLSVLVMKKGRRSQKRRRCG